MRTLQRFIIEPCEIAKCTVSGVFMVGIPILLLILLILRLYLTYFSNHSHSISKTAFPISSSKHPIY